MALPVYDLKALPAKQRGHARLSSIRAESVQATFVTMEPATECASPPHRHPYDQLVIMLRGKVHTFVDGEPYVLTAGTSMIVPAGAWHHGYAEGPESAELIELFAPVRRDYLPLTAHQQETFTDNEGVEWFFPEDEQPKP